MRSDGLRSKPCSGGMGWSSVRVMLSDVPIKVTDVSVGLRQLYVVV